MSMRKVAVGTGVGADETATLLSRRSFAVWAGAGAVALAAGCNLPFLRHDGPKSPPPAFLDAKTPAAADLVGYLNDNAKAVSGFQADVDLTARQNGQPIGLTGMVACQKPRSFRLKANILGKPGVDLGSNDDEFWYWISKADPPYLCHCSYKDLPRVKQLPFPFQPDMVLTAMGLAEYDLARQYTVRTNPQTIELIEATKSPQGQDLWKTVIFNRAEATATRPQVVAHVLQDAKGNVVCRAQIEEAAFVTGDRGGRAALPVRVKLTWPAEKLELTLKFYDLKVQPLDARANETLYSRRALSANLQTFDLARLADGPANGVTQGTSIQRASGWGTK
jgi:hypothetical protein